jgi:hypothetical protein
MKKLIELLDRYEEIRDEMKAIGCIDGVGNVNHFKLDELVKIIKDHDLEFTIGKFSKDCPYIIKVVVGKHALFAIATGVEFYRHFDSEGRLK